MRLPKIALIYACTIVLPAAVLLWLGIQSFERQRRALATLTAEKLTAEIELQSRFAAEAAFRNHAHPIAKTFFFIEHGIVVRPRLHAPLPRALPPEFVEAENQELALNRPDLALDSYRKILAVHNQDSVALSRVARCLLKLDREEEARSTWRTLATTYPDERDLSDRPYGIVAAIAAGDTVGLYDKISSGHWDLAADQAEYFLTQLDPKRSAPYLDQFRFARELNEQFRPQGALRENEVYSYTFGPHRIFYRAGGQDVIEGFDVNIGWVDGTVRPQIEEKLGITQSARQDQLEYGGAIAFVLVILSAGVLLLLRDISREARTNRLRADFVSSVSHELKTPVTLIRLYSETLLRHGFGGEQRADFHRIIARESERLSRLVDQILTFSRVERGDQKYHLQTGDLTPVISRTIDDYREFVKRAGFNVEHALPDFLPPVRFDAAALSQAVINLLDNAVKYSGQSRDIKVSLDFRDSHVVVEVEDQGIGIPESEKQKIFDRFYRIQNDSGKGGYGIGLFMVRHIMEAHGGRAEVESQPGRGSRFRLVFPVETAWANTASS